MAPPIKRVTFPIESKDICRVPYHDTMRVALACEHTMSVKIVGKERGDDWDEVSSFGSKHVVVKSTGALKPGMFNLLSGVDCLRIEGKTIFFTCDAGNNRVQVVDEEGRVLRSIGGEGPGNYQFRNPTSVSVHLVAKSVKIVDGVQEEAERKAKIAAAEAMRRLEEEEREIDKNKSRLRKPWEGHPRPEGKRGRPGGRAENISIDLASLGETAGRRLSCIIIIMRERERVERERGGRRPPEVRDWLTAPHTRLPSSSLMARKAHAQNLGETDRISGGDVRW